MREPFEVYPGIIVPAGEHGGLRFTLNSNTDRRKWISARLQWDVGTFLTGTQNSPNLQVIIRDGGRFTLDTTWTYRIDLLPQGAFHTNLGNMRVTYNFTPSVFVQSLIQYNDRTDRWSTNLRFHWLETAGTGLVRRLQRHREPERPRARQPRVHRQVRAAVRSAAMTL